MFIYFVVKDMPSAEKEAAELGWLRVAVERWVSPDRNDIRMILTERQFIKIPSGSWFLPSRHLQGEVGGEPWKFKKIVASGDAQWIENPLLGEDGTVELVDSIQPPPAPLESFTEPAKVEDPSPLHRIEDIRNKARAAASRSKETI
jgi:hypothetical protein